MISSCVEKLDEKFDVMDFMWVRCMRRYFTSTLETQFQGRLRRVRDGEKSLDLP